MTKSAEHMETIYTRSLHQTVSVRDAERTRRNRRYGALATAYSERAIGSEIKVWL